MLEMVITDRYEVTRPDGVGGIHFEIRLEGVRGAAGDYFGRRHGESIMKDCIGKILECEKGLLLPDEYRHFSEHEGGVMLLAEITLYALPGAGVAYVAELASPRAVLVELSGVFIACDSAGDGENVDAAHGRGTVRGD